MKWLLPLMSLIVWCTYDMPRLYAIKEVQWHLLSPWGLVLESNADSAVTYSIILTYDRRTPYHPVPNPGFHVPG